MSTPQHSATQGFARLPPIIANGPDREFIRQLFDYLDTEVKGVAEGDADQRFTIYQAAFNRLIDYVTAYAPVLTKVKKEYEDTIDAIRNGKRESVLLSSKLKALASEPSTLRNYRKREDDLQEKVAIIAADNAALQKQVDELRHARMEREKVERNLMEVPKRDLRKDKRRIPGLSLEASTDLSLLHGKLEQHDRQLRELDNSFRTRYVPQGHKEELKDTLNAKVIHRDELIHEGELSRARMERVKVALEAAKAYNNIKPPNRTVGDVVVYALGQAAKSRKSSLGTADASNDDGLNEERTSSSLGNFEEDDPNKDKEAEVMLEYIEKFNELFEDGKYEEAALHAANSPKGILRTTATLAKFKSAQHRGSTRSALLAFCDSLMASVEVFGMKPNEVLSCECVKCVLQENKRDLLQHWIARDRLTLTENIGDMLSEYCSCTGNCRCGCQSLAQVVYTKLRISFKTALSMLRQGRVQAALEHARNDPHFIDDWYLRLLSLCPCEPLFKVLMGEEMRGRLGLGRLMRVVTDTDILGHALQMLEELYEDNTPSEKSNMLREAIASDKKSGIQDWAIIYSALVDNEYDDIAMELQADVIVNKALKSALDKYKVIQITLQK